MIIVIDAYNVLKSVYRGYITERERQTFIDQLAAYNTMRGHTIILVFDGGVTVWPEKQVYDNISIVYPGIEQSADDYIKKYIKDHRAHELLLVSSDRELTHIAEQYKVVHIGAFDFYTFLHGSVSKKETQKKIMQSQPKKLYPGKGSRELDQLMQEDQQEPFEYIEPDDLSKKNKKDKLSKKEKKIAALLKKL